MKRIHRCLGLILTATLADACSADEIVLKPENRVAVIDIGKVFTNYEKAKQFKAEMEKLLQPAKEQAERIKAEIAKLQAQHTNAQTSPADKIKLEQAIVLYKRKLEDLDLEARSKIGKRQEEHLIALYKEVASAIKEYAEEHGINLVLGYGEPPAADVFSFANINRKLTGMDMGSSVPLYIRPGLDISPHVVDALNRALLQQSRPSDSRLAQRRELPQSDLPTSSALPQRTSGRR